MGDIILWPSLCNKSNMQNTVNKKKTAAENSFEADVLFGSSISPSNKATLIRRLFDWDHSLPFPVVQFANSLGIDVFVDDLSEIEEGTSLKGYLAIKGNERDVIVVSEKESYGHQRWTVAHELWHYFNHRNSYKNKPLFFAEHDDYDSNSSNVEEREADQFATSLLMPESEFKELYSFYNADKGKLAEHFAVSLTAVNRRISSLRLS